MPIDAARVAARRRLQFMVAGIGAGLLAGALSTLAQMLLWAAAGLDVPATLLRDARLAAAIALGPAALASRGVDPAVLAVATVLHFTLAVVYGLGIAWALAVLPRLPAGLLGVAAGLAIYAINMYGFTALWPWFVQTRDSITVAAHAAFGWIAAVAAGRIRRRLAASART